MADYINVTDADFQSVVLDSAVPVMVDFWAAWCGPCRALGPHVEALATAYKGRAVVTKMDTAKNQRTAQQLGIRGIPAIYVFKDGKVVGQMTGMPRNPRVRLQKLLDDALAG